MEPITPTTQAYGLRRYHIRILIVLFLLGVGFFVYVNDPSQKFPTGSIITVKSGESLTSVATDLKAKHIIRSTTLLKAGIILVAGEQKLVAGDYYFGEPVSTYTVASRLMRGSFDLVEVRITIPEGATMKQIAVLLSPKLPHFSVDDFMKYYPAKEGYLFPDTYFFAPDTTADEAITTLEKNFEEKIKSVEPEIVAFGKSKNEVITMASILEEEARTPTDWQIISGILWKRIKIGMPLQVDSATSTYASRGLPPNPISNPGLETIIAAVTPTTTPYFYYLSDKNGDIHYAATFAEHVRNKQQYLK